jgi:phosphohistidine phosphatase SixA
MSVTSTRRTRESYVKHSLAALALLIGCATAQPEPEPTPVPGSTTVYLVRHAEKLPSDFRDVDPSISAAGQARAKVLASRLGAAGVTAIVTTQFKRTQQTAEPLASAIGVTPEVVRAGWTGDTDSAVAAVYRHRGEKVLIVGHSKTLAPIIKALGGPTLPDLCESQYSNLYIMYLPPSGKPQLVKQHFGRGDPPLDPGCAAN